MNINILKNKKKIEIIKIINHRNNKNNEILTIDISNPILLHLRIQLYINKVNNFISYLFKFISYLFIF